MNTWHFCCEFSFCFAPQQSPPPTPNSVGGRGGYNISCSDIRYFQLRISVNTFPHCSYILVPWRLVPWPLVLVTIRPERSSPMDRHLAPPISGSWSPGAARAVDSALLLHGPLRVDRNAETEKNWTGGPKAGGLNIKAPYILAPKFRVWPK
jgi:hypothetical protein